MAPGYQSNFIKRLLTHPRSDEYGSVLGRLCSTTSTSTQLLLLSALRILTFEPDSAKPMGWFPLLLATGRRLRSVVVTPSRPTTMMSEVPGIDANGFQLVVTYL